MKKITLLSFLLTSIFTFAQAPAGYYDSTQGLIGYSLKSELSAIITNGHTPQSYGDLWDGYYTTDVDIYYENDGTVLDIYSENPAGVDSYTYTFGSDQCGNYSGEGSCYNREHLMPQSWFGSSSPMKTDIQHVYPADGYVNGQRGHLPFGEVDNATYTSDNGSKKGNNVYNHPSAYSGTVFEPIDEFKGDLARVYFYMATRYENQIGSWESANDGSQNTFNGTSDQVFDDWMLAMLIQWHNTDPVSQKEIDRNNAAFDFQGNRNPYIDNPAMVAMVWDPNPDTEAPTDPTNLMAENIAAYTTDLTWDASTDNVGVVFYEVEQDGVLVENVASTEATITGLSPNTNYSFAVKALDAYGNASGLSNSVSITTLDAPEVIFNEDFEDCNAIQFTAVSELSTVDWECTTQFGENNTGAYQMNSYSQGQQVPSTDWLITTNPLDFDAYQDEKLSFFAASSFGETQLQLLYSTNYDGNGSPSASNWQSVPNVNIPLHPNNTNNTVENIFTNIDISSVSGEIYFAFKYDTSNGDDATRWTVDTFNIIGEDDLGVASQELDFSIYPNPINQQKLYIQLENKADYSYQIYDLNGRLIQQDQQVSAPAIKLNGISNGLYVLKLHAEGKTAVKKLVIQH
ncbi:endonuclease [Mesonia sp.]|uniref:endonuclease n=1 Tax=Mesonia sp. TaxID=1960830 RepID=UPI003F95DE84